MMERNTRLKSKRNKETLLVTDVSFVSQEAGKLAVSGSCHMFSDQYIDKEENSKILVSPADHWVHISEQKRRSQ